MTALASLLRIAVTALVVTACATPLKPTPTADPYRMLRGKYPDLYHIVGISEVPLGSNPTRQADRQAAGVRAKAEIARQIRVTVKEHILDIAREGGTGVAPTEEFTRIAESHTEETLEGVKIVEDGEDAVRGVVYAVAVLTREDAIARLTKRAELAYEQANTLSRLADEAKRAGDTARAQQMLTGARQAVLSGMALEGERAVIAGGLKDLPGTIPHITRPPDLAAIEAALPPGAVVPSPPTTSTSVSGPSLQPTPPAAPAEPVWVTATGEAPFGEDTTLGQAKTKALDNARRTALESAVGIFLTGSTVVYNYQIAEDLTKAAVRGIIEEQQTLREWSEDVEQPGPEGRSRSLTLRRATIKAKVRSVPVERHGDYRLDADLNRKVFKSGDEARITVKTNHDSFIYIFNVTQDEEVLVLLPNSLIPDHRLTAGTEYIFPPEELRQRGIKLRVATAPHTKSSIEKIKVIASRKKLVFMKSTFQEAVALFSDFKGKGTGLMNDLLKELAMLDGADWTEATLPYEVTE